jgi:hypothetical protein
MIQRVAVPPLFRLLPRQAHRPTANQCLGFPSAAAGDDERRSALQILSLVFLCGVEFLLHFFFFFFFFFFFDIILRCRGF